MFISATTIIYCFNFFVYIAAQSTVAIGAPIGPSRIPGLNDDTVTSSTTGTLTLASLPGTITTPQAVKVLTNRQVSL